ncbi:tRNA-binding domain protein [Agrilactobacillus composti DSM 18527 = JCM 14202]|uniref:tRNA-binding domain protein n=1 Tax=Agrilactobacillus composti DSM 18527 = JCM 14202 TaxID=1423734 RepID=X0PPN8_9LACO|nr:DUF4479 and tRNA-binding domain-containing protein [Agrilactobacillus composti]KRM35770.1 tRNA-binding domain protein [Agrilactobacillus composti DSM 18527 = JCM 14202]GAF39632.1 phenylalanyl-tRNA synthetase domain protein [Agrilactobacillus composti DSM 18527 = JCM 14202]
MLIASYNLKALGDVLITIVAPDTKTQAVTQKGDVVRIFDPESKQTLGYNFFNISDYLPGLAVAGQVDTTTQLVQKLNDILQQNGFKPELENDDTPKFVIGYVETLSEHPDSDHLHIAQVRVDHDQKLQIVCGAPNIAQGQRVVVAKVGAMMPDGAIIWPGKLRGVESDGMISSARELDLPNAPQKRGILVLADNAPVGAAFDFQQAQNTFA